MTVCHSAVYVNVYRRIIVCPGLSACACVVSRRHFQDRTIIFTSSFDLRGGDRRGDSYLYSRLHSKLAHCHPEDRGRIILRSVDNTTRPHTVTKPQKKINCFQTLEAAQSLGVCCRRFQYRVVAYTQTCQHSVKLTTSAILALARTSPTGPRPHPEVQTGSHQCGSSETSHIVI